jgi:hypothetical protein
VLIGAALALLAVLALAGYLIGHSGGGSDESSADATNTAASPTLEIGFPDDWQRVSEPVSIPGLRLSDPIGLSQKGAPKTDGLSAGTTGATGPALLPGTFLKRLPEEPSRDDAVKLGSLEAYRYKNLQPEGYDGRLTLYVAPTSPEVTTVACAAGAANASEFLPDCESVAGNLRLLTGKAFALGPDEDYLSKLDKTMDKLNSARKKHSAQLRKAKKQAGQASAARALAGDYDRAGKSLDGLSVSPAVRRAANQVRAALAKTEAAYRRLSNAASNDNSSAYKAAAADVRAGEKALKRALKAVDAASG